MILCVSKMSIQLAMVDVLMDAKCMLKHSKLNLFHHLHWKLTSTLEVDLNKVVLSLMELMTHIAMLSLWGWMKSVFLYGTHHYHYLELQMMLSLLLELLETIYMVSSLHQLLLPIHRQFLSKLTSQMVLSIKQYLWTCSIQTLDLLNSYQ